MIKDVIQRYKSFRNQHMLGQTIEGEYAFVGVGNHSISNLYPVLEYLGVPLKYICCRSNSKLSLIERKWNGVHATTVLEDVISDENVKGVFVSVTPNAHFEIAKQILKSGKALFIEKPPCRSLAELQELIRMEKEMASVTVIGMQKRFAPIAMILSKRLMGETLLTYNMRYVTGVYPEGDALLDLFIHPLDYVCHLFGKAEICCIKHIQGRNGMTLLLTLSHKNITGVLEMSTAYSWQNARGILTVNTERGIYEQEQMETLTFTPKQGCVFGVPLEKVLRKTSLTEVLFSRNNFVPTVMNNQLYTQGYLDEIRNFVETVEKGRHAGLYCGFSSLYDTYVLIDRINNVL